MPDERERDSVFIESSKHRLYKELTEGDEALFSTMKDTFMVAATLGHRLGLRAPIENRLKVFAWSQFSVQEDVPVIKAVALASANSLDVLLDRDKMLTIVEEYANGGIVELHNQVLSVGDPIVNLMTLLASETVVTTPTPK